MPTGPSKLISVFIISQTRGFVYSTKLFILACCTVWDARRNRQLGKDREYHAVIDVRDLKVHAQLRRRWNEAFSSDPLKDYQETLTKRTQELCEHLEGQCKTAASGVAMVDLAKWISFFA